ncbi:MAG TPA: hypothetical protein VFS21_05470 [Roseiflexaceae bacterium]|nr:hypothetical protein [Roseiflexaceae bacterium]
MNTSAYPTRRVALRLALLALCLSAGLAVILPVRAAPSQQTGTPFDVYMRDTVADTGSEPSGDSDVYRSPDILVCNTRYCTEEQTPIYGQDNYVYVTLRNNGPRVSPANWGSGSLYLYSIPIGTAANWPSAWTLINVQHNITTMGGDIRTIEFIWRPTSSSWKDSYCLLARWIAANDPMTYPETVSTQLNTQNNNNIAWHNVQHTPVPMGLRTVNRAEIRNTSPAGVVSALSITPEGTAFPGTTDVQLDAELLEAWRTGGRRGVNIQQISTDTVRIGKGGGELQNVYLKPLAKPVATFIFSAPQGTTPGRYKIQLRHFNQIGATLNPVGGVEFRVSVAR